MTKAKMVIYDPKTPTEKRFIPMAIGFGKDRMRQDIDVMGMLQIPLKTREGAKALHLDKVVIITRLDKKITYLCFPGLKAYCTFPIPEEFLSDISDRLKTTQMQRTELGEEEVNQQLCKKVKILAFEPNHPVQTALLWYSPVSTDFPMKMETQRAQETTEFLFSATELKKVKDELFEIPNQFMQFPDLRAILTQVQAAATGSTAAPSH